MEPEISTIVHIALGTNLGERISNLSRAIAAFPPVITVLERSPVYETPPWGLAEQPTFLNMVIKGETSLKPLRLLKFLKRLEARLGRIPSVRYGPRLIDMDILFYDDLVLDSPELSIPHPRLHERAFVLVPLSDLSPTLVHPVLGKSIRALLANVNTEGIVRYE
jgi:2-amino-4-hydroxy-6-hydroxymethyldihydropteridine diphosphokinase